MSCTVIKIGGGLFESEYFAPLCSDIAEMAAAGERIVIIHGGGPQATATQRRLGIEPTIVGGRRVTDKESLDIMKMVLGRLNIDLCAGIVAAGGRPIGLTGASSLVVEAAKRPPRLVHGGGDEPVDFGWVGDVTGINGELLNTLLDHRLIPVLACLGASPTGDVFNINGDVVANYIASSLGANHLVLVTGAPGVLRNVADPSSRIPTMTPTQIQTAIDEAVVADGMIPKLEESVAGLARGIGAVHIVGNPEKGDIAAEISEPGSRGTAIIPDEVHE